MKLKLRFLFCTVACVFTATSAFAVQGDVTRVFAVADFDAKNCAPTISLSVSRKVALSLQKTLAARGFVSADTSTIKKVNLSGTIPADSSQFEKISSDAPDFIISGRVEGAPANKGDNAASKYWISVRIVSDRKEYYSTNFVSDWCTPAMFDRVAAETAKKIAEYIDHIDLEKKRAAIDVEMTKPYLDSYGYPYFVAGVKKPFGSFASLTNIGYGGALGLGINNGSIAYLGLDRIVFRGEIGYYRFLPSHGNSSIDMFTITGGTGYAIGSQALSIIPRIDFGYQIRLVGNADYEDPMMGFALEGFMKLGNVLVMIVPSYTIYFDNKKTGTMVGFSAGIGYKF